MKDLISRNFLNVSEKKQDSVKIKDCCDATVLYKSGFPCCEFLISNYIISNYPLWSHKRQPKKTEKVKRSSKGSTVVKKLMETCQKGKMVNCLAPTCGHSSESNFQVLRFSKRYKAEQRVQEVDTTPKVLADIHKECKYRWEFEILSEILIRTQFKRWHYWHENESSNEYWIIEVSVNCLFNSRFVFQVAKALTLCAS